MTRTPLIDALVALLQDATADTHPDETDPSEGAD